MILDEGMDSGPILARKEERIFPEDTTETLTHRLFEEGAKLLIKSLPGYLQGDLIAVPQDQSRATYTTKLKKEDGRIRWDLPLDTVARQIRAYSPWPGSYTLWKGRILKRHREWGRTSHEPGSTVRGFANDSTVRSGANPGASSER